jgi:hypothetical protein
MWSRIGLLLVLATAVLAFDREVAKEHITNFRIKSQNLHIDELEAEVHKLEAKFGELSAEVTQAETNRLRARVRRNIVAGKCPHHEVSCGGDWPECVHNLLFCDGVKDCHNGMDEDKYVCSDDIIKEGSSFSGVVHWSSCLPLADHNSFITITAMHRAPYFGSRAFVRAQISNDVSHSFMDHQQGSYTARGYFVFATRQLALLADDNAPHNLAIVCTFNYGDYDHAMCRIMTEAAKQECARMRVSREFMDLPHHVEWHEK